MSAPASNSDTANQMLTALPKAERSAILAHAERVTLAFNEVLSAPNTAMPAVYFPITAVVSLRARVEDGHEVEIGMIGYEGLVGLPVFLGAPVAMGLARCQIPGDAFRLTVEAFHAVVAGRESAFVQRLLRYTQALMVQTAQIAACDRLHPIEARVCRWLVMTHDRARRDTFPLTQQSLAHVLGIRRAGVSTIASELQRAGILRYHRGMITILDRARLEAASCACSQIIRSAYEQVLTEMVEHA
jgi:CRP-like cAMP-binding protein